MTRPTTRSVYGKFYSEMSVEVNVHGKGAADIHHNFTLGLYMFGWKDGAHVGSMAGGAEVAMKTSSTNGANDLG